MGKDPVCHEDVDERSAWSSTYQDRTYYFNSAECKADFDRDPGRFAASGAPGMAGEARRTFQDVKGRTASRAKTKIKRFISDKKGKAAENIGAVSNAFRTASQRLREQNQEAVARYADRAAEKADRFSSYLQQADAEQILSEAENFVRRRPGLMIGGALVAGFIAARFLKSSKYVST